MNKLVTTLIIAAIGTTVFASEAAPAVMTQKSLPTATSKVALMHHHHRHHHHHHRHAV